MDNQTRRMKRLGAILIAALFISAALAVQVLVQGNAVIVQGDGVLLGLGQTNAVPWSPEMASNTMLEWLRSDDLTSYPSGALITSWPARTGNNGISATPSDAPTFRTFGGSAWQRYAEFGGASINMRTDNWTTNSYSPPFVWALAFRKRGNIDPYQVPIQSNGSEGQAVFYIFDSGPTYDIIADPNYVVGPSATDFLNWHTLIIQWAATTVSYSMDGSSMSSQNNAVAGPLWGIVIGQGAYDIGEVIVWQGTLSGADTQGLTNYFNTRWH